MNKWILLHTVMYGLLVVALIVYASNYSILYKKYTVLRDYSASIEKINLSYANAYNNMLELKNVSLQILNIKTQSELTQIEGKIKELGEKDRLYGAEIEQYEGQIKDTSSALKELNGQ